MRGGENPVVHCLHGICSHHLAFYGAGALLEQRPHRTKTQHINYAVFNG